MSDSVPFDSLSVGTEAGTGDCVMSDAIPFDSLAAGTEARTKEPTPQSPTIPIPDPIPNPNPIPPSGAPIAPQAPPIAIPIPIPPSGASRSRSRSRSRLRHPLQPLLYLLSKLLHAPHSRFRQIFNNGQDFRYAHVTYDETGHPGRCAKDTENHIAG